MVRWGLAAVLVLTTAGFYGLGLQDYVSWDYLHSHRDLLQGQVNEHLLLAVVLFFLLYTAVAALSLPVASVLGVAAGAVRPLVRDWGREPGRDGGERWPSRHALPVPRLGAAALRRPSGGREWGVERDGACYLLALRLVPFVPFFLVNLGMGLTPMRVRTFLWASLLGMVPGTFLYVNAGTELGRLKSPLGILSPSVLLSLALLGVVPLVLRRLVHSNRFRFPGHHTRAGDPSPGQTVVSCPVLTRFSQWGS